jgi:hypothetical protein
MLYRLAVCWILAGVLPAMLVAAGVHEEGPRIVAPQPYQVIQREGFSPSVAPANAPEGDGRGWADVEISWISPPPHDGRWQARTVPKEGAYGKGIEWTDIEILERSAKLRGTLRIPAGGWYRLEVKQIQKNQSTRECSVEPFGVGEVFLIAGQSYAGGHNDELLKVTEPGRRVAAFNWQDEAWQICDDPVPHVGPKGTIWPALGDLLAPLLQVPVGFVNASVGGTSTRQWAADGPLFADMVKAGRRTGRFRAVLWQQGESDVIENTATDVYVERLIAIRGEAMKQWGWDVPWLPAKSTLHPTVYRRPDQEEAIRRAIDRLWSTPGFRPGPDTDVLDGENRGGPHSMRHFTGIGQRRAAQLWFAALWSELHRNGGKD